MLSNRIKSLLPEKDSPLVIGIGESSNYIGSDILSFLPYTRKYISLENGERVVLTTTKSMYIIVITETI